MGNRKEEFREYLIENERAKNTINSYMITLKKFFENYQEVNKENMIAFKQDILETRKPSTAYNYCVAMNQYCKFINHPEFCVKRIKIPRKMYVENVITLQQYNRLINKLQEDGDTKGYWRVVYLAKTGARISEFIELKRTALDLGYQEMWTKGKTRRIYIPKDLIKESRDFFANNTTQYLFESRYGKKITSRGIAAMLQNFAKKYEIPKEVMHPHSFRHLYAVEFLKRNPNISLLADLMGHSSVNTTSIYLKLSEKEQITQFNDAMNW